MITPLGRRTFPMPTYPEIRLAFFQRRALMREIANSPPMRCMSHRGALGLTARRICLKYGIAFTTPSTPALPNMSHARFRMCRKK